MTSAIERTEAVLVARPVSKWPCVDRDDLTEVLRLAQLGERVEQCDVNYEDVRLPDGQQTAWAYELLAWIKGDGS